MSTVFDERPMIGRRMKRTEDPALITGQGAFIDDLHIPGCLHLCVVRSTHAHARIMSIDTEKARASEGVHLVLTGGEIAVGRLRVDWDTAGLRQREYECIAVDRVRYCGQPIAVVVATSAYEAEDAARFVEVAYDDLPVVLDAEAAREPDATILYEEWGTNETCDPITMGKGDIGAAFALADHIVHQRVHIHRHSAYPLETRGCLATYERATHQLTIFTSTQSPNQVQSGVARCLGLTEQQIRVRGMDVGGGFGMKDQCSREEVLVSYLAMRLKRPVKWIEGRPESFVSSSHAREQIINAHMAVDKSGKILGLKAIILYDAGAHHESRGALPAVLTAAMLPGPYAIEVAEITIHSLVTNKVPSGSYRGFGQPQAVRAMESLMDEAATVLGMDPADVRRRNYITPQDVGRRPTVTDTSYDSGDYPRTLEEALHQLNYQQARAEQQELRKKGVYRGIGMASFVESTGLGPSRDLHELGVLLPAHEAVRVVMDETGGVTVYTGIMPIGQGMKTAFAQIACDALGITMERIRIVHGDTDACSYSGLASAASRGITVGGTALQRACETIRRKLASIAAAKLEVDAGDIVIRENRVMVNGVPATALPLSVIAHHAWYNEWIPAGETSGLSHEEVFNPPAMTFACGTHVCVVEVDIETGMVAILRYVACKDCGTMVNPTLVEGQVHGGIAQGVGAALCEELVYDEQGHLLTTDFTSYHLLRAAGLPEIEIVHLQTPSPHNPGGFKGVGEGGTIPSYQAVLSAVRDALVPFGVTQVESPLTPERVWRLVQEAQAKEDKRE